MVSNRKHLGTDELHGFPDHHKPHRILGDVLILEVWRTLSRGPKLADGLRRVRFLCDAEVAVLTPSTFAPLAARHLLTHGTLRQPVGWAEPERLAHDRSRRGQHAIPSNTRG